MITRTMLLVLMIGFYTDSFSQVGIFYDVTISPDKVYLFGPDNVSRYFDEQAEIYIQKYTELEEQVEIALSEVTEKRELYKTKRVRNEAKLGEMRQEIERYELELELLSEIILSWEIHQEIYTDFKTNFIPFYRKGSCYCYQQDPEELCNTNIEILELSSTDELIYEEYLRHDYKRITRVVSGKAMEEARKELGYPRNRRGIPVNDETSTIEIIKRDLYNLLRSTNGRISKDAEKTNTEITDYGERLVERMFGDLNYDSERGEVYWEVDYTSESPSLWIINTVTDSIIPSSQWDKIKICNE